MWEVAELVIPCPTRLLLPIYPAPGAMREELSSAPAWICLPPPRAEREAEGKYAQSCRWCIHGPVRSRPLHGPYQYGARRVYSRVNPSAARSSRGSCDRVVHFAGWPGRASSEVNPCGEALTGSHAGRAPTAKHVWLFCATPAKHRAFERNFCVAKF